MPITPNRAYNTRSGRVLLAGVAFLTIIFNYKSRRVQSYYKVIITIYKNNVWWIVLNGPY
jgi:hypothetical protein